MPIPYVPPADDSVWIPGRPGLGPPPKVEEDRTRFAIDSTRDVLVWAISAVAQKACRNGEAGAREWPDLRQLPFFSSWRCVGETYADQVLAEMAEAMLRFPDRLAKATGGGK